MNQLEMTMVMFAGRVKIRINANHPKRIKNVKELPIILTDEYNIDVPPYYYTQEFYTKKFAKNLELGIKKTEELMESTFNILKKLKIEAPCNLQIHNNFAHSSKYINKKVDEYFGSFYTNDEKIYSN